MKQNANSNKSSSPKVKENETLYFWKKVSRKMPSQMDPKGNTNESRLQFALSSLRLPKKDRNK